MAKSTVISRGRTTIPIDVRVALHVKHGTRLEWHVMPDGSVILRAKTLSIKDLAGSLKSEKHVDIDDMNPWLSR